MVETIRYEGFTLPVSDVARSVEFYRRFGFQPEHQGAMFALMRRGEGTIGLLRTDLSGWTREARGTLHVELSTDHLDALYEEMKAGGLHFHEPPHDEPWERSMATYDPDGYTVEIAQGRRGRDGLGS